VIYKDRFEIAALGRSIVQATFTGRQ